MQLLKVSAAHLYSLAEQRQHGQLTACALPDKPHAVRVAAVALHLAQHPCDASVHILQHVQRTALQVTTGHVQAGLLLPCQLHAVRQGWWCVCRGAEHEPGSMSCHTARCSLNS
jgi:hypothetical protein